MMHAVLRKSTVRAMKPVGEPFSRQQLQPKKTFEYIAVRFSNIRPKTGPRNMGRPNAPARVELSTLLEGRRSPEVAPTRPRGQCGFSIYSDQCREDQWAGFVFEQKLPQSAREFRFAHAVGPRNMKRAEWRIDPETGTRRMIFPTRVRKRRPPPVLADHGMCDDLRGEPASSTSPSRGQRRRNPPVQRATNLALSYSSTSSFISRAPAPCAFREDSLLDRQIPLQARRGLPYWQFPADLVEVVLAGLGLFQ